MSTTLRRGEDVSIPPIQRLSDSTISRLRSSVNITSLVDCISELVQNSLDAHAKSIKISVNLERNSCSVEDDGWGIPPEDLKLVGERYASSKHAQGPLPTTFGHRGEALASIATNSLLSVTSRARTHRSTQLIRFSYGTTPIYSGIAPEHMRVWGEKSGTTVKVETLFGNFPVRLKARENLREVNSEREWEELRKVLASLLMSAHGKGVGLILRDVNGTGDSAVKMMVKPKSEGNYGKGKSWEVDVLRQIFGVGEIGSFSDWEWVRARRGAVSIEGWISKVGCASKRYQFLSINAHPLNATTSCLHSELNDTIANSRFGHVEEETNKENLPKKLEPEARNPIDRWAKCIFRINVEKPDNSTITLGGEGGTDGKAGVEGQNLKAVVDLLQKLVTEFLKSNMLRPRQAKNINSAFKTSKASSSMSSKEKSESASVLVKESQSQRHKSSTRGKSTAVESTRHATPEKPEGQRQSLIDLEAWTNKAKSAKRDEVEEVGRYIPQQESRSIPLMRPASSRQTTYDRPTSSTPQPTTINPNADTFRSWTNPISKKDYQINSRTGNIAFPKPPASQSGSGIVGSSNMTNKRLRIAAPERNSEPSPFIQNLLDTWKNPVFPPVQPGIPRLCIETLDTSPKCCSNRDSFLASTSLSLQKITKEDLRDAEVIAQIDRKFILVQLHFASSLAGEEQPLLALIDQHAASERIRVERFFAEICHSPTPSTVPQKPLLFQLSTHESGLLEKYAGYFQSWGITYQLNIPTSAVPPDQTTISISTLPTQILTRCEKDPALAIDLLRRYAHHLSDLSTPSHSHPPSREGKGWIESLGAMPKGLVEMVNNKACRGAVMFNDPLSLEECRAMVRDLAGTRFPFICAHGRPSMVPCVDLGKVPSDDGMDGERVKVGKWRGFLKMGKGVGYDGEG